MKSILKTVVAALVVALVPATSSAALIDFEGLADGAVVTNQFAGVTFSSNGGFQNLVTAQAGIGAGVNFLCTGSGGILNCTQETILTFFTGVSGLSFLQVGDNQGVNGSKVAEVDVFVGGVFSSTVDILGDTNFNNPNLVDLTAFSNVTSIRIHNITDGGGLGWDNFAYTTGGAAVPEPASLALLGLGLAGLGFSRRKRNS